MDNNTDLSSLNVKRDSLYKELLICSEMQKNLVVSGNSEEEVAGQLILLSNQWNKTTAEIDEVQNFIELLSGDEGISNSEQTRQLLLEMQGNIDFVESKIRDFSAQTGVGLRNIKNQQKVMKAYYHLESRSKDQIPLYFDEKK